MRLHTNSSVNGFVKYVYIGLHIHRWCVCIYMYLCKQVGMGIGGNFPPLLKSCLAVPHIINQLHLVVVGDVERRNEHIMAHSNSLIWCEKLEDLIQEGHDEWVNRI